MESSGHPSALSSGQELRPGQKKVVEHFQKEWNTVAQLPTGYGKTLAGAACYKAARLAGKANRLLWIVPRRQQAAQAAEEIPFSLESVLGVSDLLREEPLSKARSWNIGVDFVPGIKAHRTGTCEIFIVTIQSLMTKETVSGIQEIMRTGLWMLVVDEHHHYGDVDESRWVQAISSLSASCRLAMSATPERRDRSSYFPDPDIVVSYVEAAERERSVKRLSLDVYDYTADVIVDDDIVQYTCDQLFDLLGVRPDNPVDAEAKMVERKMRWSPKYISPLILKPIDRLAKLRQVGVRGQMLIQAMTCEHAKMLCGQVRSLIPDGWSVDWVGTGDRGRKPEENEAVLDAFCPPKDAMGRRNWSLDILINVGMAGEGLDTIDVCEIVFCSRPSINPTTLQTIGRAARLMRLPRGIPQPIARVNVDKVSELRDLVGRAIMGVFDGSDVDDIEDSDELERASRSDEYQPMPDEPWVYVANVELTDILQDPIFREIQSEIVGKVYTGDGTDFQKLEADVVDIYRRIMGARDAAHNGGSELSQIRDQVAIATTRLVNLVIRIGTRDLRIDRTAVGDIKRRINSRRKKDIGCPINEASIEQAKSHYSWCKSLELQLLENDRIPLWLA